MPAPRTILHVEDNFDNRLLVRRLLNASGYKLSKPRTLRGRWNVLKTLRPDLILMDINMPDIDGYTLTSQIKSFPHLLTVPVIAITANVMKGDRERTLQAGCDGYIEKPIDVDRFVDQVEIFLK